jgi:hypothetical protein
MPMWNGAANPLNRQYAALKVGQSSGRLRLPIIDAGRRDVGVPEPCGELIAGIDAPMRKRLSGHDYLAG